MQKIANQANSFEKNIISRPEINDENVKRSPDSSKHNSSTFNETIKSERSKRKCVLNQNKRIFLLDEESEEDYIENVVPIKKNHVLGRGRGRPRNQNGDFKYVFTSHLANCAAELLMSGVFSSLAHFHHNCHFPNGIITHEAVKASCDMANKHRLQGRISAHQNIPIPRDANMFKNVALSRDQVAQFQRWGNPMQSSVNVNIPDRQEYQQHPISNMNSADMRQFPPNPRFLPYGDGVYPAVPNDYFVPFLQPRFNGPMQQGNVPFQIPPLKPMKDENNFNYNQFMPSQNQNTHLQ